MSQRVRRKRRQLRQGLKHGRTARPLHQGKSGRTGGMHEKKTLSKARERFVSAVQSVKDSVRCKKCGVLPGEEHRH